MTRVHATAVAFDKQGVLITGDPASGKSDLALRLIAQGAVLVSDDQVLLSRNGGDVVLSPPDTIAGMMEVRGIGVVKSAYAENIPLRLVIDLVPEENIPRLPEPAVCSYLEQEIPVFCLNAFQASVVEKVRLALDIVTQKREFAE